MQRNEFLQRCGLGCLGVLGLSALIPACSPAGHVHGTIINDNLVLPLSAFSRNGAKEEEAYRRYIIIRNEKLNYPLVVYREEASVYSALLLRCSHQYSELNVNGDLISCPAHGSEFDRNGNVVTGPAENKLRSFRTTIEKDNLYIHLV